MISLSTFGGVSIRRDGIPLTGRSSQRRRLALLALLAVARDRGVSRDKLLAYLWPDHDANRGRHALSQLLYAIRRDLGEDCLVAGIDDLRVDPKRISSDVAEFDEALERGDRVRAAAVYGGQFLDGFFISDAPAFEHWAEETRLRYMTQYAQVLASLGSDAAVRGDFEEATTWLHRWIALDPLNPQPVLQAMRAREALGDRAGALQYARAHSALVRSDLGVPADTRITDFMARLMPGPSSAIAIPVAAQTVPTHAASEDATPLLEDTEAPIAPPVTESASQSRTVQRASLSVRRVARWAAPGLAAVVLAALLLRPLSDRWAPTTGSAPEVVVLGAVSGVDTSLSLAVREILRAELAAAPGVVLLSDAAQSQTLALMKLDPRVAVTDSVAVEVAQRRGITTALTATVTLVGEGAEVVARVHRVRPDDVTTSLVAAHAARAEEIPPKVRRLAATLRDRLRGIRGTARLDSMPAVSTSSLPALRAYALARRDAAAGDRLGAVNFAENALRYDSAFVMAHYLLGDLYWFLDRQSLSDRHLTEAARLSDRIPLRERLLVKARHAQIVLDDLDSARTYWYQLQAAFPREALAYEGRAWTHRAAGETWDAYLAADSAMLLDPDARVPNQNNKLQALLSGRPDTARALAYADSLGPWAVTQARRVAALERRDWDAALRSIDDAYPPTQGCGSYWAAPDRQAVLLAANRVAEAARELEVILCWARGPGGWPHAQMTIPNALLSQGRAEVALAATRQRALQYARRALDFVDSADISPPAIARMTERAADIAARGGDAATVARARRLIVQRDAGRQLRSYRLALLAIDAASAYLRGDFHAAATLAERAKQRTFFGRSNEIAYLLEADARRALGEYARSDSLYRASRAPEAYLAASPHLALAR